MVDKVKSDNFYLHFRNIDLASYSRHKDYNEYYYIYLQNSDSYMSQDMQNIFHYCWRHHFINCIVQIKTANNEVLLYTYYPFTADKCRQIEIVEINAFNGTSLVHKQLFPKTLRNFHGCPLRVALRHIPPYMMISNDSNGQSQISGGFEGKLLMEISRKLNFSLDIKLQTGDTDRAIDVGNVSLLGVLQKVSILKDVRDFLNLRIINQLSVARITL